MNNHFRILISLIFGLLHFNQSIAQEIYPSKPVKIVHGFAPGGGVDLTARLIAQQLQEKLGQNFIVEGKSGAGGSIAAASVAASPQDGYTLFLMASGHSIAPALNNNLPFDSVRDFTMLGIITKFPFAIAVKANSPYKSIQDLISNAKENSGKNSLGNAGIGTGMHLASVLLQQKTKINFNDIPYRGGSLAPIAAAAGEIDAVIDNLAGMDALLQGQRLRLLAVTSKDRWPGTPAVPTLSETVSPGFDVSGWYAIAGPKNLPSHVVQKISNELRKIMAQADVTDRLKKLGLGATFVEPSEAQLMLASEVSRWTQLVKDEKIKVD